MSTTLSLSYRSRLKAGLGTANRDLVRPLQGHPTNYAWHYRPRVGVQGSAVSAPALSTGLECWSGRYSLTFRRPWCGVSSKVARPARDLGVPRLIRGPYPPTEVWHVTFQKTLLEWKLTQDHHSTCSGGHLSATSHCCHRDTTGLDMVLPWGNVHHTFGVLRRKEEFLLLLPNYPHLWQEKGGYL